MADTNKETLVQKLTDIADGFRTSRSLTETLSLDDMATLAAVPISGGEGDKNLAVYTLDQFTFDGSACTGFDASKNKYIGTLLKGCIIPYSNGGTVIDTVKGAERNPDIGGFFESRFTGYDMIVLPENIIDISAGCFNESTLKEIIIEADKVIICGDEADGGRTFRNCYELTTLDTAKLDLSENATSITALFQNCEKLPSININHWDTSNVTNMSTMFHKCVSITTLDLSNWDTRNVTNMGLMFQACYELITLDISNWDTSNVTNMRYMFGGNESKLVSVIGSVDMLNVLDVTSMFPHTTELRDITLKNIKLSPSFKQCVSLSEASILNIAQELWDKTGHPTQTLIINNNIQAYITSSYVKLIPITAAMREQDPYIDNKKPCEVCESTDAGAMTLRDYILSKNWAIG